MFFSLLEKLTSSQLVSKFPAFYGTRKFITVFTEGRVLQTRPAPQLVKKYLAFYGTRRFIAVFTSARHLPQS